MRRIISLILVLITSLLLLCGCDADDETTTATASKKLSYTELELKAINATKRDDLAFSDLGTVCEGTTMCEFINMLGEPHYINDVTSSAIAYPNVYGWEFDDGRMLMVLFEQPKLKQHYIEILISEGYDVSLEGKKPYSEYNDEDRIIDTKNKLNRGAISAYIVKDGEETGLFGEASAAD